MNSIAGGSAVSIAAAPSSTGLCATLHPAAPHLQGSRLMHATRTLSTLMAPAVPPGCDDGCVRFLPSCPKKDIPQHPAARGLLQAGSPVPTPRCSAGQQLPAGLGTRAAAPGCPQLQTGSASPWTDGLQEGTGCAQLSAAFPGEGSRVRCPGELLAQLLPGSFDLPPLPAPSGRARL